MTIKDINTIIEILCPNDEDYEKPIISPKYLRQELEQLALEQEPCDDAISRQAAIREYQEVCNGIKCGECPFLIKVNTEKGSHLITDCKLEAFLHNLPSAERRGRWIMRDNDYIDDCKCSECGCVEYFNKGWKHFDYCPNCGARMMDEVEENE